MKFAKGTKKSLSGFTLLEILIAMLIVAIILPVLVIAFYQTITVPPNDTVQLSLNDEVGLLSAMLYQDGSMADNFTEGTGPVGQLPYYYGNFSWTNYSNNGSYYFVSYSYNGKNIVRTMTVTPKPPTTYILNTTVISGSGTITPASGLSYNSSSVVPVAAIPAAGWAFASWSGDLSGSTNPTTITMDGNKSVNATFTQNAYTLTSSVIGSGSISPSSGSYNSGSAVQVTATPAAGWTFTGWYGDLSGSTNPATITMNSNKAISATFTQSFYTLTTSAGSGGAISPSSGNSYASGTVVTVTATPSAGYSFSSWSGDLSGSTNPTTITMNSAHSVTANFALTTYTLTITYVGNGTVTPTSGTSYNRGTAVTLNATPAAQWAFSSWSGDLSGTTSPAIITMNSNKAVTATFINVNTTTIFTSSGTWTTPPGVTSAQVLVVAGGGQGGGSSGTLCYCSGGGGAGGVIYNPNFAVSGTITVTVGVGGHTGGSGDHGQNGSNSVFGSLTAIGGGGGARGGSDNAGYSGGSGGGGDGYTYGSSGGGSGNSAQGKGGGTGTGNTWVCSGNGAGGGGGNGSVGSPGTSGKGGNGGNGQSYSISGSAVTYAAGGGGAGNSNQGSGGTGGGGNAVNGGTGGAASGYGSGGGGSRSDGGSYAGGKGSNGTVIVNYTLPSYTLTTSAGSGGSITPASGNSYASGTVVQVSATPSAGYTFTGWSGDLSGSTNPTVILMNSNKAVTANFAPYTLTTSVVGSGSITPASGTSYSSGQVVTVTATPATGWTFSSWSGDLSGSANPTTITMNSNKSVTATFTQNTYALTTTIVGSGSIFTNLSGPYASGSIVQLTAIPATGWFFSIWSGDLSGSTNPTTITMNSAHSVTATFTQNTYTLTTAVVGSGSITPASGPQASGAVVTVTATPSAGWNFIGWSGDLAGATNPTTITMNSAHSVTANFLQAPAFSTPATTTTSMVLSWHITQGNFNLSKTVNYILANILANSSSNMGKPITKQLTIEIAQRPSVQTTWVDFPVYAASGLFISGSNNIISGDVRINGTVSVTGSTNQIVGTLACNGTIPSDISVFTSRLSFTPPLQSCTSGTMPDIGQPQDYFQTNLTAAVASGISVGNLSNNEYVFSGNVTFATTVQVYNSTSKTYFTVYNPSTHSLNTGKYYSNGTITLSGDSITADVTFIANRIIINNDATSNYNDVITLTPYDPSGLLFWANGSSGSLSSSGDGDIQINGASANNPCVALEGVLYAPKGEIELAGSGAKYWNLAVWVIYRATLDKGAVIGKYITISGSYWDIYRW